MTCERCIHYDICNEHADGLLLELAKDVCFRFKDKDSFVSVVRCKDCDNLYFKDDYYCCANHRGLTVIKPDTYCPYGERDK